MLRALERWVQGGARLLRVERAPLRSTLDTRRALLLMLTFDRGRLVIGCGGDGLELAVPQSEEEVPENLLPADEDDPWWTLMGTGLRDASDESDGSRCAALHLRFRPDHENPRLVTLRASDGQLHISSQLAKT